MNNIFNRHFISIQTLFALTLGLTSCQKISLPKQDEDVHLLSGLAINYQSVNQDENGDVFLSLSSSVHPSSVSYSYVLFDENGKPITDLVRKSTSFDELKSELSINLGTYSQNVSKAYFSCREVRTHDHDYMNHMKHPDKKYQYCYLDKYGYLEYQDFYSYKEIPSLIRSPKEKISYASFLGYSSTYNSLDFNFNNEVTKDYLLTPTYDVNNESFISYFKTNPLRMKSTFKIVKNYIKNNFLTVETITGTGSGVAFYEQGDDLYILTCYHVIDSSNKPDNYQLQYQVIDGYYQKTFNASLIALEVKKDLAILLINKSGLKPLIPKINTSFNFDVGQRRVLAVGCPHGEMSSLTTGEITSQKVLHTYQEYPDNTFDMNNYVHTAFIDKGNSGGGLFDINYNLIGINASKTNETSNAITALEVYEFLNRCGFNNINTL